MKSAKYLSLALVLVVVGVVYGKAHHQGDLVDVDDSNLLKIQSGFKLSMPLFLRNVIDALTSTHAPPTSSKKPCQVSSCQNGGSLVSSNNGSCPTCECAPGCNGTSCETCSSVSTTTLPSTTKLNCNTLSCMNGGSVNYDQYGNCWCNCQHNYQGDFCEYQRMCSFNVASNCNNGGTMVYNPDSFTCSCHCPSCYYGSLCESYYPGCMATSTLSYTTKPTCNSMRCMNSGFVVYNGTSCKCACPQSYAGEYCELYNTCNWQVSCGNVGKAYYDPAVRMCQCSCPAGLTGTNCFYSI